MKFMCQRMEKPPTITKILYISNLRSNDLTFSKGTMKKT